MQNEMDTSTSQSLPTNAPVNIVATVDPSAAFMALAKAVENRRIAVEAYTEQLKLKIQQDRELAEEREENRREEREREENRRNDNRGQRPPFRDRRHVHWDDRSGNRFGRGGGGYGGSGGSRSFHRSGSVRPFPQTFGQLDI